MRPALVLGLTVVTIGLFIGGGIAWHKALWRMGGFKGPPPIVKDLITGSENGPWTRRLRETYPVGSSERILIQSLQEQGFEVTTEARQAAYGWADFPCVYTLTLTWRADETHRIRSIQGAFHNACTDPKKLMPEIQPRAPRQRPSPSAPSLVEPAQSA